MTTHRIEKKVTSKQFAFRICKTVEGYLDWICHSEEEKIKKNDKETESFKTRAILKKTVAMLMTRAISRSKQFEKCVELAQEKEPPPFSMTQSLLRYKQRGSWDEGGSAHKLLKKMLIKQSDEEYTLYMFIRKPKHRKQLFQLVNGYPNPLYPEHAMVSMNSALLKEEKIAMRKELKCLLDAQDNISPEVISSWILPVLHNGLNDMDGAELDGYVLEVHPVKGLDSYSCLLQYMSTENQEEVHDITLNIKLGLEMNQLPAKHQLQHPYPRSTVYDRKGRQMLKELQSSFAEGTEALTLCSELYTSAAKLDKPKKRKKPSTVPALTRLRLQQIERSRTAIFGKRRIEDKKVWTMDFTMIEKAVQQTLVKTETPFHKIEEALVLYNNLTKLPTKVVPPLNEATQVALSLWLFKNSGTGNASEKLFTNFMALLHLVQGCFKGNFCPAFFLPSYNTMAPKITETNPMGIDLEAVISDLSDLDESEEEENAEADEAGTSEGQKQKATEVTASEFKKTVEKDIAENPDQGKAVRKNHWQKKRQEIAERVLNADGNDENSDKQGKEKQEKEVKMSGEEKVEYLITLIETDDLQQVIDYIDFH